MPAPTPRTFLALYLPFASVIAVCVVGFGYYLGGVGFAVVTAVLAALAIAFWATVFTRLARRDSQQNAGGAPDA